ncbi:MAG: hypothetical protein ABF760_02530 [Zymomonas mobilis]|uniref:Uncharacterized protein n=1 Tax=Zymomonas mobilis TaxID=542 RepID=A0A542W2Z1_ZYMMB|nr:hypothetical protein [Zymomonas mobilis]TQL17933.1 hypothetical protein FBY58_1546 [Zymomonas mobilis]
MKQSVYRPNHSWFLKFVAALFLGAPLTLGIMGIAGLLCHSEGNPRAISSQFLMWMISPLWVSILSLSGLFRSTRQAWGILAGCNLLVWAIFFLARGFYL